MLAPTYLSDVDRNRLVVINQLLMTRLPDEESINLRQEQIDIMGRRKNLPECTYPELQELRQQLFDQYQKHAAIGSKQTATIAQYLRQVEFREMVAMAKEPELVMESPISVKPIQRGHSRVSSAKGSYSWTLPTDADT